MSNKHSYKLDHEIFLHVKLPKFLQYTKLSVFSHECRFNYDSMLAFATPCTHR